MGTKQSTTTRPEISKADATNAKETGSGMNQAIIVGEMIAEPERRTLPSGTAAASFSLTVRSAGRKTTSVPIVWYDPPKRMASWKLGDMIAVRGSVVRRFFRGGGGLGSSTEVVVEQAELVRQGTKLVALLNRTCDELTQFSDPSEQAATEGKKR